MGTNMMKQTFQIGASTGTPTFANEQFIMVYNDPYGGIWRTDAIDATSDDNVQHLSGFETPHTGHHTDSKYSTNNCKHASTAVGAGEGVTGSAANMDFNVEFADKPGQTGVQYLIEVDTR